MAAEEGREANIIVFCVSVVVYIYTYIYIYM